MDHSTLLGNTESVKHKGVMITMRPLNVIIIYALKNLDGRIKGWYFYFV